MIKIAFPEWSDKTVALAIKSAQNSGLSFEAVSCEDLETACLAVKEGIADAMIAGINYTSRDIILACKNIIGVKDATFSASFLFEKDGQKYVLGDAAACKNPTAEQLYDIVLQTYSTAKLLLDETPRVAMLSFSTFGSGGHDPSIERIQNVVKRVQKDHPDLLIDGEMQLDAAVNSEVASKKAPGSKVAGRANVLIVPDLNSGNILYKSLEQFGGFVAAGPILQGFNAPISDLSRGSTAEDIKLVIQAIIGIASKNN